MSEGTCNVRLLEITEFEVPVHILGTLPPEKIRIDTPEFQVKIVDLMLQKLGISFNEGTAPFLLYSTQPDPTTSLAQFVKDPENFLVLQFKDAHGNAQIWRQLRHEQYRCEQLEEENFQLLKKLDELQQALSESQKQRDQLEQCAVDRTQHRDLMDIVDKCVNALTDFKSISKRALSSVPRTSSPSSPPHPSRRRPAHTNTLARDGEGGSVGGPGIPAGGTAPAGQGGGQDLRQASLSQSGRGRISLGNTEDVQQHQHAAQQQQSSQQAQQTPSQPQGQVRVPYPSISESYYGEEAVAAAASSLSGLGIGQHNNNTTGPTDVFPVFPLPVPLPRRASVSGSGGDSSSSSPQGLGVMSPMNGSPSGVSLGSANTPTRASTEASTSTLLQDSPSGSATPIYHSPTSRVTPRHTSSRSGDGGAGGSTNLHVAPPLPVPVPSTSSQRSASIIAGGSSTMNRKRQERRREPRR